jgi:WD40 repeat protein
MDFQKGQITALSHGDRFFAIGRSEGQVSLYDPTSLQVLRRCEHPERVSLLEFSPQDLLLASCGAKHLVVWDTKSCTMLHSFSLQSSVLAITFLGLDEILGVFKSCTLTKWYVKPRTL